MLNLIRLQRAAKISVPGRTLGWVRPKYIGIRLGNTRQFRRSAWWHISNAHNHHSYQALLYPVRGTIPLSD
eukprot:8460009-Pyramimonas_sp.AAC.1